MKLKETCSIYKKKQTSYIFTNQKCTYSYTNTTVVVAPEDNNQKK